MKYIITDLPSTKSKQILNLFKDKIYSLYSIINKPFNLIVVQTLSYFKDQTKH